MDAASGPVYSGGGALLVLVGLLSHLAFLTICNSFGLNWKLIFLPFPSSSPSPLEPAPSNSSKYAFPLLAGALASMASQILLSLMTLPPGGGIRDERSRASRLRAWATLRRTRGPAI